MSWFDILKLELSTIYDIPELEEDLEEELTADYRVESCCEDARLELAKIDEDLIEYYKKNDFHWVGLQNMSEQANEMDCETLHWRIISMWNSLQDIPEVSRMPKAIQERYKKVIEDYFECVKQE